MYNNDSKYMDPPEAGLASLLSSRGRNGDSVLVHMAPQEVQGLQQLAMAHGGSLTINPETGLYEASFLKKILPMLAGAVLGPGGTGIFQSAFGTALAVGAGYGLLEGDLKKGLMAGLGAYSGSNITSGLRAAAGTSQVSTQPASTLAGQLGLKESELISPPGFDSKGTFGVNTIDTSGPIPAVSPIKAGDIVQTTTPRGSLFEGARNLVTGREGAGKAFMDQMGGSLGKYATIAGAMIPFAEEPKPLNVPGAGEDIVYIPGGFNPNYGTGANEPYQLPGKYYKRTSKGMTPYNPYQMAPGFAEGGEVDESTGPLQINNPNVIANRKYVEELNRRAMNPEFNPYGMNFGGGLGGTNTPWSGLSPYGTEINAGLNKPAPEQGGGAAEMAAFLATQVGMNWMMQPGNATALKAWVEGGMKWDQRPFMNADKTTTPPAEQPPAQQPPAEQPPVEQPPAQQPPAQQPAGSGVGTGAAAGVGAGLGAIAGGGPKPTVSVEQVPDVGQTPTQQPPVEQPPAQQPPAQQPTPTGEAAPVFDPVTSTVIAGGMSAAAIAAAKALAAQKGAITVALMDGTIVAGGATASAAAGAGTAAGAAGSGAAGAGTTAGTSAGAGSASGIGGAGFPGGVAGAGLAALAGAHQAYEGIRKGKEGQAAAGGALAGAGGAYLAGTAGLGGAGLTTLAGFGPVGLAAAAIAAIGASLVNTKEMGDVALRNYWKAVDQGRGLASAPPQELAEGFINFYRTNKNQFAGQDKYGRKGNEDFVYDMTQVVNNAVKDGLVSKDATPEEIYQKAVQPWLNSMGPGPQNADARRIQDFMLTDMIYNFMLGRPISNAQVKNDKNYKIVSEKPIYAGNAPPLLAQLEQAKTQALGQGVDGQALGEFLRNRPQEGGLPQASNPFAAGAPAAEVSAEPPAASIPVAPTVNPFAAEAPQVEQPTIAPPVNPFAEREAARAEAARLATQQRQAEAAQKAEAARLATQQRQAEAAQKAKAARVAEEEAGTRREAEAAKREQERVAAEQARIERERTIEAQRQAQIEALQNVAAIPPPVNPFAEKEVADQAISRVKTPTSPKNKKAGGGAIGEDYNFGFAVGGMPEYKAGGKLLNGPGDGMSDDIPAVIRGKGIQRAALADGEFVIPADVVSHLGNGSTKAGAKKLYQMMDRIRQARTGNTKQAPAVKADKYLPV